MTLVPGGMEHGGNHRHPVRLEQLIDDAIGESLGIKPADILERVPSR